MERETQIPAELETGDLLENIGILQLTRRELLGLGASLQPASHETAKLHSDFRERVTGGVIIGLTLLGVGQFSAIQANANTCNMTDIACQLEAEGLSVPETMRLGPIDAAVETTTSTVEITTTTATTSVPTTTTTLPPPPPTTTTAPPQPPATMAPPNPETQPASPEAIAAIEAMNLTPEGYQNFFNTIDYTWFDYAQGYANFNPAHSGIAQNATEWVTAHFTASYTNPDGPGSEPVGDMVVQRLIDMMGTRGHPCCGINFIIDRNGRIFQTAPFNAKLRHDPPGDGRSVGYEIEAARQDQIVTAQYESAAYLTIATLANEGLLGSRPFSELLKGHGEMRDNYRAHNHGTGLDQRNDFDAPVMGIFRSKIESFIVNNPNLAAITGALR